MLGVLSSSASVMLLKSPITITCDLIERLIYFSIIVLRAIFFSYSLFGGIYSIITMISSCLSIKLTEIKYSLILSICPIYFSQCSFIIRQTPEPFFLSFFEDDQKLL